MRRTLLIFISAAVCIATLALVLVRQRQLADLRTQQQELRTQLQQPLDAVSRDTPGIATAPQPAYAPSLELLRLRAEVTRLGNRKLELANARVENKRLHGQFATRGTNVSGAVALPVGYIRKSKARRLGYDTPEATMETILWAIQNQDFTNVLQAFTPDTARELQRAIEGSGGSMEEFFNPSQSLLGMPGMCVLSREQGSDDTIALQVEMVPGEPPETMRFQKIKGQWKMETY